MPSIRADNRPSLERVASGSAHALNNVAAILWAARELLAEGRKSSLERACQALEDAAAGVQAVSDALAVLSLTEAELEAIAGRGRAFRLRAHDVESISFALSHTSRVETASPSGDLFPMGSPLDCDTLKAVLVCMAVTLRREAGKQESLSAALRKASVGKGERTMCLFEISAVTASEDAAVSHRAAEHPCAMAIQHARRVLARFGVLVEHDPARRMLLMWPEAACA